LRPELGDEIKESCCRKREGSRRLRGEIDAANIDSASIDSVNIDSVNIDSANIDSVN
jgi:hypothetical protein